MDHTSQRVLFIGNSYTNRHNLAWRVFLLGESATPQVNFATQAVTEPMSSLRDHWERGDAQTLILGKDWDTVVLQERREGPTEHEAEMCEYATKFDEVIRDSGAATMLFMAWPKKKDAQFIDKIAEVYERIGQELGAVVAPVAVAWQQALQLKVDLYAFDNWHPNEKGTYLAALVFFAKLTGRSPIGLSTAGFDIKPETTVEILQQVAHDVTR